MIAQAKQFDFGPLEHELARRSDEWFAAFRRETQSSKVISDWSDVLVTAMLDKSLKSVSSRANVGYRNLQRWQSGSQGTMLKQAACVGKTLKLSLDGVFGIVPISRYRFESIKDVVQTLMLHFSPTVVAQQIGVSREMFYRAAKHSDCRLVTAVKLAKFFSFSLDRLAVVGIKGN